MRGVFTGKISAEEAREFLRKNMPKQPKPTVWKTAAPEAEKKAGKAEKYESYVDPSYTAAKDKYARAQASGMGTAGMASVWKSVGIAAGLGLAGVLIYIVFFL